MDKNEIAKTLKDQMEGDDGIFECMQNAMDFYCESRGIDQIEYELEWNISIRPRTEKEIEEEREWAE